MATDAREAAVEDYRKKLLKHKEIDSKVRSLRESVKELKKEYDKTEDDLRALQSVGQIIGEVLRQLDDERCERDLHMPHTCLAPRVSHASPCVATQSSSRQAAVRGTWWAAAARWTRRS